MKFSIRDLMFVTAIVALAVGWWVDRGRLAYWKFCAESLARALVDRGYKVEWLEEGPSIENP